MKKITKKCKIAVVGTGAVGSRLSVFFSYKKIPIHALVNSPRKPAKRLTEAVKPKHFGSSLSLLRDCNVIFLSVPDTVLESVSEKFKETEFTSKHVQLIHTSGSLTSDILRTAKDNPYTTIYTGSMHPMQTFPKNTRYILNANRNDRGLQTAFFGLEGDPQCITFLKIFLKQLSCAHGVIPAQYKVIYHIGGVFANNFLVAMIDTVMRLYSTMEINKKETLSMIMPLIENTLFNCTHFNPGRVLTGPAARRDYKMIERHLTLLNRLDPLTANAYHALTEICFRMKVNSNEN